MNLSTRLLLLFFVSLSAVQTYGQTKPKRQPPLPPISSGTNGKLVYTSDSAGNRVPDFSVCGYMGGDEEIPDATIKILVPLKEGDATERIQSAIDYVGNLPAGANGIRGAVLLQKGTYQVDGSLSVNVSGVVLRGSGMGESGTILYGAGQDRQTLIRVFNKKGHDEANRLSQIGIENIQCVSAYDPKNPKDEAHRWMAIVMEDVQDAWVRQVVFRHFAGSAVSVLETGSRITVEWCKSLDPVSEIGGQRRNTFYTSGRQTLFQHLYSEYGYHDFGVGFTPRGPNAFVECMAYLPYSYSGPLENTASEVLYDVVKVDGNILGFPFGGERRRGGTGGVSLSVLWQCTASRVNCFQSGLPNWAFGTWSQTSGNGNWFSQNEHINPWSLYYAQLADRLGEKVKARAQLLLLGSEPSSSPTVAQAAALTVLARKPLVVLSQWIDQEENRHPIPSDITGVKTIDQIGIAHTTTPAKTGDMIVSHGWLVRGNSVLTGSRHEVTWWRGSIQPAGLKEATPHITRYVPGRTGTGLTDDLNEVTDWMLAKHVISIDHNYGLWYDRRRDDHERIRRMDGDVVPPFYELPFARSGTGTAWDGLSKYDLTSYNTWYWKRLQQFANLADQKGLVLIHENYFQHNIIEAGAHYADYPWRSANNINNTPFSEPPPFAGDKRLFLAEQYYDLSDPAYRSLHRAYIRKCMDNFSGNTGVIQLISAEYTGPLHFVQFWIDVIKEWENETGKKQMIGLSTTKDVQDSLLADKDRATVVNLIDIRYWHYQADGSAYAPKGGQSLSPRQHERQLHPKPTSFAQVYRAVREYHDKYPGKAITYSGDSFDKMGWAVFMAGGSLAAIPAIEDVNFLHAAATMQPADLKGISSGCYVLSEAGKGYIIYAAAASPIQLDLSGSGNSFTAKWIDPATGRLVGKAAKIKGGKLVTIPNSAKSDMILLITASR